MMANGWKTPQEIMKDYGLEKSAFAERKRDCIANPEYRDAIVQDGRKMTYIIEERWQAYLRYRSEQYRIRMLDPHIRKARLIDIEG